MYKLLRTKYTEFSQLPLEQFNELNIEIYITDYNWNFLFVNDYALRALGASNLVGKNMWGTFGEATNDPNFHNLKKSLDQHVVCNFVAIRNMQKQNIVGYPLKDCFYISATAIPNKQDLIQELRAELCRSTN